MRSLPNFRERRDADGPFEEFAFVEEGSRADKRDQVWCVDRVSASSATEPTRSWVSACGTRYGQFSMKTPAAAPSRFDTTDHKAGTGQLIDPGAEIHCAGCHVTPAMVSKSRS
jgi:hypothetical protein